MSAVPKQIYTLEEYLALERAAPYKSENTTADRSLRCPAVHLGTIRSASIWRRAYADGYAAHPVGPITVTSGCEFPQMVFPPIPTFL